MMRGIRGATTLQENTREEIDKKVRELLSLLIKENEIALSSIGAIIFSSTSDIKASFPATSARKMGLETVPLFSTSEPEVVGDLPLVIRLLMLIETEKSQSEIRHIYLHEAIKLRPDCKR